MFFLVLGFDFVQFRQKVAHILEANTVHIVGSLVSVVTTISLVEREHI